MTTYPQRLIEVDLPIRRISAHARREKSIRHGHISTLHIWWARRPLAACRAVLCAALWPDPADPLCPPSFRAKAAELLVAFAEEVRTHRTLAELCAPSYQQWKATNAETFRHDDFASQVVLRQRLLDFIADFANWDASTVPEFLRTARALTQAAHEALGGIPGTRPLVVDPFAGGGAIPLEALRVGADAFASDLNPVAVLLNKVVLEYIPRYGQQLADEVRKWGQWVKEEAEKELAEFYPPDPDGATPIAYIWARTIRCEGPVCGAEVPLMRSMWLAKKSKRSVALRIVPDRAKREVNFEIFYPTSAKEVGEGTVKRGSATCPVCGYTTPVTAVRHQFKARRGGAADARLVVVVTTRDKESGRFYRLPKPSDLEVVQRASAELERRKVVHTGELSLVPDEPTPQGGGSGAGRAFSQRNYGMNLFGDLFTPRQLLALTTLTRLINEAGTKLVEMHENELALAIWNCLSLALGKQADSNSSLCGWRATSEDIGHTFVRQALPMMWDFVEANVISGSTRDWQNAVIGGLKAISSLDAKIMPGTAGQFSAFNHPLPNDATNAFVTDPPYYDAVPYADLSDYFIVWFRRTYSLKDYFLESNLAPKDDECIVDERKNKDKYYFESSMEVALQEGRRVLNPLGIGIVVFAHKTTSGWEAQLQSMINAGWTITGSWPIDTEMGNRLRAMNSAALASSIHLVCRPREDVDGNVIDRVGEWRDVLAELPERIRAWLPRLDREGVKGADAIFACLGPALEIFSRYSRVERSNGEEVTLSQYLEYVWAAVAREALALVFAGADASRFEPDARLTVMWLWTLSTGTEGEAGAEEESSDEEGEEGSASPKTSGGFPLEYDAARKIAQGLGVHLAQEENLVQVRGSTARLLGVTERRRTLGLEQLMEDTPTRRRPSPQLSLDLDGTTEAPDGPPSHSATSVLVPFAPGKSQLDRVHQAMLLFAAGRPDALRRFLLEDGVGKDSDFWQLAQALNYLYPIQSQERTWVEGLLGWQKTLRL